MLLRSTADESFSALPESDPEYLDRRGDFLKRVFEAAEKIRLQMQDGTIGPWQCELRIGDSRVSIGQSQDGAGPRRLLAHMLVPDTEVVFACALQAGATEVMSSDGSLTGTRGGSLIDPFGNAWSIATLGEELPPA
jgi:PhnB protein